MLWTWNALHGHGATQEKVTFQLFGVITYEGSLHVTDTHRSNY